MMAFGKDLLTDDVGVPAVLGEFAEQMQVDPAQRKRAAAVTESEIVEAHRGHGRPRGDAGLGVGGLDGRDGVGVREQERVGHVGRQPLLDARDALDTWDDLEDPCRLSGPGWIAEEAVATALLFRAAKISTKGLPPCTTLVQGKRESRMKRAPI